MQNGLQQQPGNETTGDGFVVCHRMTSQRPSGDVKSPRLRDKEQTRLQIRGHWETEMRPLRDRLEAIRRQRGHWEIDKRLLGNVLEATRK